MDEVLIGFQLRVAISNLEQWKKPRRMTYLIREDIEYPLSVDTSIWPLCTNSEILLHLFDNYSSKPNASPNGLDIYNVKSGSVLDQSFDYDGACLIGITTSSDAVVSLKEKHYIQDIPYSVSQLKANNWKCLGYDVADHWLYSGLMNSGYDANSKQAIIKQLGETLNSYGLFISPDTAKQFCKDCNQRIAAHAPFIVYGIWAKIS